MCQVLRSWYRAGIIRGHEGNGEVALALQGYRGDETQADVVSWLEGDSEVDSEASEAEDSEYGTSSSDSEEVSAGEVSAGEVKV
jgi:hypothetical protein